MGLSLALLLVGTLALTAALEQTRPVAKPFIIGGPTLLPAAAASSGKSGPHTIHNGGTQRRKLASGATVNITVFTVSGNLCSRCALDARVQLLLLC